MDELIHLIWYSLICGAGCRWAARLVGSYPGGIDGIWAHEFDEDEEYDGVTGKNLLRLNDKNLANAERVMMNCAENGIRVISFLSDEYPQKLRAIEDCPVVLYALGNIEGLNDRLCVSVVGTRRMSEAGKIATFKLVRELSAYDPVIISGGALGVDCAANKSALYFGADTIAVLGSGVDVPYPSDNRELFRQIAEQGMLISEFPPGTRPDGRNFPIRNRIISGLCDALLVVEAPVKSGALITARLAAMQGRRLFAVPGDIFSANAVGTNQMIKEGAKLCTNGEDIVYDLEDVYTPTVSEAIVSSRNYRAYENKWRPEANAVRKKPITPSAKKNADSEKTAAAPERSVSGAVKPRTTGFDKPQNAPVRADRSERSDVAQPEKPTADENARAALREKLSETEIKVFDAIPDGGIANTDMLVSTGLSSSDIMTALTLLELSSAIESLPGGAYRKLI